MILGCRGFLVQNRVQRPLVSRLPPMGAGAYHCPFEAQDWEGNLMTDSHDANVAWARFLALRNDPPRSWNEREVSRFHEVVTTLEKAFAVDLSAFRIPDSELKQIIVAVQRAPRSGRFPGQKQMSDQRYCDDGFARRQIEGLMLYFQSPQPPPERPQF